MLKYIQLMLFLLTISLNSLASSSEYVTETFNKDTGLLYWDLNSEVRLTYISPCRLDKYGDYSNDTWLHRTIKQMDIFSVLDYGEDERFVVCKKRGLRTIYRLREDQLFPSSYSLDITINNEKINYLHEGTSFGIVDMWDSENYQKIFSALQTQSTVAARIVTGYFSSLASNEEPKTIVERLINVSHLDESDAVKKRHLQKTADNLNGEIRKKYKFVIIYDLILALVLILALFLYKSKVHPFVKITLAMISGKLTNVFRVVRKTTKRDAGIIKTDKLKSYSVADELSKWVKLKESGHISEEEYEEARAKLLKRD